MKFITLLFVSTLFIGCGKSHNSSSGDDNNRPQEETTTPEMTSGSVNLWDRTGYDAAVFLPVGYDVNPDKKYPVIISLYGLGGSVLNPDHTEVGGQKSGFIKQVWNTDLARTYQAIVIAPEVGVRNDGDTETVWNTSELIDLIEDAEEKFNIDGKSIVLTGFSAGSLAAQGLALREKEKFAGIMPGAFEAAIKLDLCSVADLPIWAFGNSSDDIFQPASWSGVQSDIKECSTYADVFRLSIANNRCEHGCWDSHWARSDVQTWLRTQKRSE